MEQGKIALIHLHAIEEIIRYVGEHPGATYDELVKHISWYWNDGTKKDYRPQGWVLKYIKLFEESYEGSYSRQRVEKE